jgi:hypothetical protein
MCDEHFHSVSAAMCSYVAMGKSMGIQRRKKLSSFMSRRASKDAKIYDSGHLFNKNKVANAALLELLKEDVIEL